jgi:hypothetical protein
VSRAEVMAAYRLARAFPWAERIIITKPALGIGWHVEVEAGPDDDGHMSGGGVDCYGRGRCLRDAVRDCLAAWRRIEPRRKKAAR